MQPAERAWGWKLGHAHRWLLPAHQPVPTPKHPSQNRPEADYSRRLPLTGHGRRWLQWWRPLSAGWRCPFRGSGWRYPTQLQAEAHSTQTRCVRCRIWLTLQRALPIRCSSYCERLCAHITILKLTLQRRQGWGHTANNFNHGITGDRRPTLGRAPAPAPALASAATR